MSAAALAVEGLSKRFGAALAVDGLSFAVAPGEFLCLVGPSGCGKTTALRLIGGLEQPSSGRILGEGRDITALRATERGIGMVFQSYALFPNMTAAQNIAFALDRRMTAKDRRARIGELLELVDLCGFDDKRPQEMSGGQQQRIAIARALARAPRVLLLDEPLSALDPQIRGRLRSELKSLQRRLGITAIMVTHDQAEALAVADRIAVMRSGRLLQLGAPESIYRQPADAFTASFVGAMNLLPAIAAGPDAVDLFGRHRVEVDCRERQGTRLRLAVRPEAVELGRTGSAILATVAGREFQGAYARLSLRVEGYDGVVLADAPDAGAGLREGDAVGLRLPRAALRLFPEAPA